VALLLVETLLLRGLIGGRIRRELLRPSRDGLRSDRCGNRQGFQSTVHLSVPSRVNAAFHLNQYARQADGSLI
jgi:hypothetical protein